MGSLLEESVFLCYALTIIRNIQSGDGEDEYLWNIGISMIKSAVKPEG